MQTDFNELTCKDVFNQVRGLQIQNIFGANLDMIYFDEVIILQKNKDKIICESLITLSNNDQSWYDMMIYKENGTIFYKVEPKTFSSKKINTKSISSNNTNNEKLVIPSFDKLVKEKNVNLENLFTVVSLI